MSQSPEIEPEVSSLDSDQPYIRALTEANSMINRGASFSGNERNCFFTNTGNGFVETASIMGIDFPDDGRAVARVDWDNDGDQDLWITNRTGPRIRFLENTNSGKNSFLSVKLTGRSCNRNAIGARVELILKSGARVVRSVRAGEGFISQSSKRIHLGIADNDSIDHLIVHWPHGTPQTFHGLVAGKHYYITQDAKPTEWNASTALQVVRSQPDKSKQETPSARVLLDVPLRIPQFEYETLDGNQRAITDHRDSPLLISLWANWCQPCLREIDEWKIHANQFKDTGLEVLLLNVEPLHATTVDSPDDVSRSRRAMAQTGSPFGVGVASSSTIHLLQVVHDTLLRNEPLPLPTSFLFDKQGRLAAVYKGTTSSDQILNDLRSLGKTPVSLDSTLPFTGKWHGTRMRFRDAALFRQLLDQGLVESAKEYRSLASRQLKSDTDYPTLLIKLGNACLQEREFADAEDAYREALELDPNFAIAHFDLGLTHEFQGKREDAIGFYRKAIELNPKQPQALLNLGVLLAKQSGYRDGLPLIDRAIEVRPAIAIAHFYRGRILTRAGRLKDARQAYLESYRLDPNHVETWFPLAKLHEKYRDQQRAIELLRKLVSKRPELASPHVHLGVLLESQDTRAAIKQYQLALSVEPNHLSAANNLSWLFATCADADLRHRSEAIRLAKLATRLTNSKRPDILDTLAAAHANDGQFDEAVKIVDHALKLARTHNLTNLQQQLQSRRELYANGQPFRSQ